MLLNCGVGEDSWKSLGWRRESNQSILKEINCEYSLEGLMLKLNPQYFGHQMWRTDSLENPWCWERLRAGGEGDNRGCDGWMALLTQWTWVWVSSGSWRWTGKPGLLQSMGSQTVGHDWATELNWWVFIYIMPMGRCFVWKDASWEFPGGPVVRTLFFYCWEPRFNP